MSVISKTANNKEAGNFISTLIKLKIFFIIIVIIVVLLLISMFFASTLAIIEYLDFGDILENHEEEIGTVEAEGSSSASGTSVAPGEKGYEFFQADYADVQFGTSNIKDGGCGITSMAMCVSDWLGRSIDPRQLASEFNINPYWISGSGVSWSFFGACAEHYGLQCQELGTDPNAVVQALKEGKKVLSSQDSRGPFTKGGHIIYFYGLDSSGNIVIKDPNKYNAELAAQTWDPSEICSWSKNNFAIWK